MLNRLGRLLSFSQRLSSAVRFIKPGASPLEQSIIYKAANIIASDKIEGDYLEFGVFSGGSFIYAYHVLRETFGPHQTLHGERTPDDDAKIAALWQRMRFFAFDSFQGLPEPRGIDKESRDFRRGKYACSEKEFLRNLSKAGVPLEKVVTVAGLFADVCTEETRIEHHMSNAAIVHIDCDYYFSTRVALDFITPLIANGTIIIFDDWYCFQGNPELGEQRAFHEWAATLADWSFTQYQKEGPWSNSFICNRRRFAGNGRKG